MVQLRARQGALGALCGPQLHRPPAYQTQGRELGAALPGAASWRASCGAGGDDGGRQDLAAQGVRGVSEDLRAPAGRRPDEPGSHRPGQRPVVAVEVDDGGVPGEDHKEDVSQLRPAEFPARQGRDLQGAQRLQAPASRASVQAAATASRPWSRASRRMRTMCSPPFSRLSRCARTCASGAGRCSARNGAPLRIAPGLRSRIGM